tara:strand:- start:2586 stop:3041 length:456 start_codon:yes stop_codon:yes gene_type:complete
MNKFAILFIILVLGLVFFMLPTPTTPEYEIDISKTAIIKIKEIQIAVEIADTPQKHKQGLSGRESLPKNEGLLFIFNKSDTHGFWMKDMNFPIDIIWINENWMIVDITENISAETFPEIFEPRELSRYVLEVNANFVRENNISIGDKVSVF